MSQNNVQCLQTQAACWVNRKTAGRRSQIINGAQASSYHAITIKRAKEVVSSNFNSLARVLKTSHFIQASQFPSNKEAKFPSRVLNHPARTYALGSTSMEKRFASISTLLAVLSITEGFTRLSTSARDAFPPHILFNAAPNHRILISHHQIPF